MRDDWFDLIGHRGRGHGAGCPGVQIGHQCDALLTVKRAINMIARLGQKRTQLGRRADAFDLEQFQHLDPPRHLGQQRHIQFDPGQRRVLEHDGNPDLAHALKLFERLRGRALHQSPVVRCHHHDHIRAHLLGLTRARHGDVGRKMADRHNHRHTARDMLQTQPRQGFAFRVRQQELFGVIGKDADTVAALIDHTIHDAAIAVIVQCAIGIEGRRCDGPDTVIGFHSMTSKFAMCSSVISIPRPGASSSSCRNPSTASASPLKI